ncbi:MAG: transglutaminase family protein, partial [Fimbriiglobus sp.]
MLLRVGYEIGFDLPQPAPVVVMLSVHPSRAWSVRQPEHLRVEPAVPLTEFTDGFGNRCGRVFVPAGRVTFRNDAVVEDSGLPDPQCWTARQHLVQELPFETIPFLLPSRYCEVDSELKDIAWTLFGTAAAGWPRVAAVCTYVHN